MVMSFNEIPVTEQFSGPIFNFWVSRITAFQTTSDGALGSIRHMAKSPRFADMQPLSIALNAFDKASETVSIAS